MAGFLLLLASYVSEAQVNDPFSDGDFTDNPEWVGNTALFTVNAAMQLQLNSNGEGTAYLSTPISGSDFTEWRIWVKLAFSPSDNNNARIYLLADQQDISQPLNGFYLKLGESGSADAIELYRQSGTASYLICRGTDGLLASAFELRIRVVRSPSGTWNVYADSSGGEDFQFQASGEEPFWETYTYLGVVCKYTSSNAARFYFDDVYAGPAIIDDIKPRLLSAEVSGTDQISLFFSEPIDEDSASDTGNYSADQNLGHPVLAWRNPLQTSSVTLTFAQTIAQGTVYNLTVQNIADLAGNILETTSLPFAYYNLKPFDVVINEAMADPEPVVGLPPYEYLELFNKSDLPVQLENWELSIGTTRKKLDRFILAPGAFVILCSEEAAPEFSAFGPVMDFPSFSLANTGTMLTLRDAAGAVIHSVSYTDNWYRNNIKKNGGWSLEQIDPSNPCGGYENWRASNNPSGGSPGSVNSVNAPNADLSGPVIQKISITGDQSIRVFFSEPMDSLGLSNPSYYSADQGLGEPLAVYLFPPDYKAAGLVFGQQITAGIIYTLSVQKSLTDCAGNETTGSLTARFAIADVIEPDDIVINEVLYDPRATGTDFVEIYNRSDKVLDIRDLWLANRDNTTGEAASVEETAPDGRLMFPGEYLVLTRDAAVVRSEYFTPAPYAFVEMASFPTYPNDEGTVLLITPSMEIIDEFAYTESMQFALLNSTDGVSLERLRYDGPSMDPGNWHSASQNVGFATPAYQNSQFTAETESGSDVLISPEIFSPDNDGNNDVVSIACNSAQPGNAITIRIYNSNGRLVRNLVKNEPAGTASVYTWDGITEDNEKAPIGIYIVSVEVLSLDGKVSYFKKTTVLGGKI